MKRLILWKLSFWEGIGCRAGYSSLLLSYSLHLFSILLMNTTRCLSVETGAATPCGVTAVKAQEWSPCHCSPIFWVIPTSSLDWSAMGKAFSNSFSKKGNKSHTYLRVKGVGWGKECYRNILIKYIYFEIAIFFLLSIIL